MKKVKNYVLTAQKAMRKYVISPKIALWESRTIANRADLRIWHVENGAKVRKGLYRLRWDREKLSRSDYPAALFSFRLYCAAGAALLAGALSAGFSAASGYDSRD